MAEKIMLNCRLLISIEKLYVFVLFIGWICVEDFVTKIRVVDIIGVDEMFWSYIDK